MVQYARPISSLADLGWDGTPDTGAVNLWKNVDEAVISDVDKNFYTPDIGAGEYGDIVSLTLSSLTNPLVDTGFRLRIRVKYDSLIALSPCTGGVCDGNLRLAFTISNSFSTVLSSYISLYDVAAVGFYTTQLITLSEAQANTLRTTGNGLSAIVIGLQGTYRDLFPPNVGSDTITVSWVEFEVPDVGGEPEVADIDHTMSGGIELGGEPDISFGMYHEADGGIEFDGSPSIILSVDASGIYTLVAGQTYDRIYNRQTGQATIDVKIPDPFGKTGFLGG